MKKYSWRNYIDYMRDNPRGLWFKMRLYGWGWVPVSWQGWLVIVAFVGILLLNGFYFSLHASVEGTPSSWDFGLFFGVILASVFVLFWICSVKGEWPQWCWGRD